LSKSSKSYRDFIPAGEMPNDLSLSLRKNRDKKFERLSGLFGGR